MIYHTMVFMILIKEILLHTFSWPPWKLRSQWNLHNEVMSNVWPKERFLTIVQLAFSRGFTLVGISRFRISAQNRLRSTNGNRGCVFFFHMLVCRVPWNVQLIFGVLAVMNRSGLSCQKQCSELQKVHHFVVQLGDFSWEMPGKTGGFWCAPTLKI